MGRRARVKPTATGTCCLVSLLPVHLRVSPSSSSFLAQSAIPELVQNMGVCSNIILHCLVSILIFKNLEKMILVFKGARMDLLDTDPDVVR